MLSQEGCDSLFSVRDRVVVVTGGLGMLGRQFVFALADRGAKVAVLDLDCAPERVNTAYGERAGDPGLLFVSGDVTDRASLEQAAAEIESRWGAVWGLVNNAAIDSPPDAPEAENGPFEDYPAASWDRVMEANVKGVFQCCQVFGGMMARHGQGGSIVNIGSIYGIVSPDQRLYEYRRVDGARFYKPAAYSASKSALLNLTRYLATYWADARVRANMLTLAGVFNNQAPEFLKEYLARMPMKRMANSDEYNGALVFLLSPASAYMTGANLVMDGGWTAW